MEKPPSAETTSPARRADLRMGVVVDVAEPTTAEGMAGTSRVEAVRDVLSDVMVIA
jgi:hypothetical protein